jgi:hypothetical protein
MVLSDKWKLKLKKRDRIPKISFLDNMSGTGVKYKLSGAADVTRKQGHAEGRYHSPAVWRSRNG